MRLRRLSLIFICFLTLTLIAIGCAAGMKQARPVPKVSLPMMDGSSVDIASQKGRPMVVNFGASWCPHCINELANFDEVNREYRGRVGIYMVFVDSKRPDVERLMREKGGSLDAAFDPGPATSASFGVTGLPVTFFIDAEGNIVEEYLGYLTRHELEKKIGVLFEKPSQTQAR